MKLPRTLLARTVITIAGGLLVFLLFSGTVVVYYVMMPMAQRAAEDLAALMVFSAQTWVELPPDTREDFEKELFASHGLKLISPITPLPQSTDRTPYVLFFEEALTARMKEKIPVIMYLTNGVRLKGFIKAFDNFVVLLKDTNQQLIYKHAISTIQPERDVDLRQD